MELPVDALVPGKALCRPARKHKVPKLGLREHSLQVALIETHTLEAVTTSCRV